MIERLTIGDRDRWLEVRGQDVTASVVGALFGVHPFVTRYQLALSKMGIAPPVEETAAMRRGNDFEPIAVDKIKIERPAWRLTYNARDLTYYRDPEARIGATPDLIVQCPQRGPGIVQIKTTSRREFRRTWLDEDGIIDPPLWICLQAEQERYLTGGLWAAIAVMTVDEFVGADVHLADVPVVDRMIDTIKAKTADFWQDVEDLEPGDPDFGADAGFIDRLYPDGNEDDHVDLTSEPRVATLLAERQDAVDQKAASDAVIRRVDAEIKHMMGDASVAHIGRGRRITWRNESREGRYLPPSNGRVLRVPGSSERG